MWTGEAFVRGAPLPAAFTGEDHPVVCATWAQAETFCAWQGKRLPTEAEWERAARGPEARHQYPWGDAAPTCKRAQTYECGQATAPVGRHPAGVSPEGVHDLAGNASEWVADWYHPKTYLWTPRHNPAGPDRGQVRVVRGGSFYDGPGYLRASYRYGLSPQWGYGTVGFRCAR
ncbi:formylglycine-generating enzyme family protein [Nannocystis punicea]|uniref:SUMF1/EgtB/PvdO family nonheme iron enzyme n=1 Tax=Nannocystis punicea TaxID=2995304 RepID=A0ABY7H7R7_9BACT|nr:SUMF1/EgtB/PvdO family nonheme iron enzyme [Nannocystis poenicansa]WAS95310.1 SUMF1/EgtB/PvdO family nonheme iron enzyme [Nannocystis poenicansa]